VSAERKPAVIGVDLGATKLVAGSVAGCDASELVEHPTSRAGCDELLDGIESAVREVIARSGRPDAIGIGVPSQVEFATGRVAASVNVPFLEDIGLREELGGRLATHVYVDNDANCAALAEVQLANEERVGSEIRYLVMYTLGTGVGGGVVLDGKIFRGASGLGAELGHVVVDADGPRCQGGCPSRGCLEAFCSGSALTRDASALAREKPDSALGLVASASGEVDSRDAEAAARAGDGDALALFERLGSWLGVGIAGVVNTFEPQCVVIGGGLSRAADLFLDAARGEAATRALPAIWRNVDVCLARGGVNAGVIGAGLLAAGELAHGDLGPRAVAEPATVHGRARATAIGDGAA